MSIPSDKVSPEAHFDGEHLVITIEDEPVRRTKVIDGRSYEFRCDGEICHFIYLEKNPYAILTFYPINMFNPQILKIRL